MMLNKQMLAVAFAAGATFLVGCDEDAQAGECAGAAFFEEMANSECSNCLKGDATDIPDLVDANTIQTFEECGVEFKYACNDIDAPKEGQTATQAAAETLIDDATTAKKFNDDETKNSFHGGTCKTCFTAHFTASTKTSESEKVDDALEECGVELKAA